MNRSIGRSRENGYLLPVTIALGMAISIVSVSALSVISQNNAILNAQYYNQLAVEAAQAGFAAAKNCIVANAKMDWDTGGNPKLGPQTDCDGNTVSGRPTTVYSDNNVQSTYSVSALENPYGDSNYVVASTGKVTITTLSGVSVGSYTKTIRTIGQLQAFGILTVSNIGTGDAHSCGVQSGQAYCWGYNADGELGNGTTANSTIPVPVDTSGVLAGHTVTDISAGNAHSCAVADGQAYCWGLNNYGQLGNSTTTTSKVPVAVDTAGVLGGHQVTSIRVGDYSTCAIADGQAYCWGYNAYGELGNGTTTTSKVPVAVNTSGVFGGHWVSAISASLIGYHTCAVADGQAYCWGYNGYGQLGNNTATTSKVPVAVDTAGVFGGHWVSKISAGGNHSCAVADGQAYCWGYNGYGQLGNGTVTASKVPVAVNTAGVFGGHQVTSIADGGNVTCAVADGQAYCWGYNGYGQLGNNTATSSTVPVAVLAGPGIPAVPSVPSPCGGWFQPACITPAIPAVPASPLYGQTVTDIAAGQAHSCAIASGQAFCWGYDNYGQLGNGATTNSKIPVSTGLGNAFFNSNAISAISAGQNHACTIADSQAYCWGYNAYGQLGNGTATTYGAPVAVSTSGVLNGQTVTAISAGVNHTCAVAGGQAYCWGYNGYGQLGNGTTTSSTVPVAVSTSGVLGGHLVIAINAGGNHTCAVADNGQAYCWGYNGYGQLGNGTTTSSTVPVAVATWGVLSGQTATDISAGDNQTCAIASGQAYCWGNNFNGQLGNGASGIFASSTTPVAVSTSGVLGGHLVTNISTATYHSCAVADSQAYCWGYNGNGQLGNGTTTSSTVPVAVSTSGVLGGHTVTFISTGGEYTCAVADSQAYCWGYNGNGQLGTGTTTNSTVPIAVNAAGLLNGRIATAIDASNGGYTCAVADSQAYCWGYNTNQSRLGNGLKIKSSLPVSIGTYGTAGNVYYTFNNPTSF